MKEILWDQEKDKLLQETRGVGFKEILEKGSFVEDLPHPTRDNQRIFIFRYNDYPYCVPYVEDEEKIFLKTIFPNRNYK